MLGGTAGGSRVTMVILLAFVAYAVGACMGIRGQEEEPVPTRSIEAVQEAHTEAWMRLPGVVGTGIALCDGEEPCIRVFLARESPETAESIPDRVEGYRVELVVTGGFRARPGDG